MPNELQFDKFTEALERSGKEYVPVDVFVEQVGEIKDIADKDREINARKFESVQTDVARSKDEIASLDDKIATIQLTPGPQGERGIQGPEGKAGAPGKDGLDGKDGKTPEVNLDPMYSKLREFEERIASLKKDDVTQKVLDEIEAIQKDIEELKEKSKKSVASGYHGGGAGIKEVVAGAGVTVDNTILGYPVVSASGSSGISESLAIAYAVAL